MIPSREAIRKIIELTSDIYNDSGDVWGHDTDLGNMENLIDKAIEIIKEDIVLKEKLPHPPPPPPPPARIISDDLHPIRWIKEELEGWRKGK
jgi:hypothetical protein